MYSNALNQVVTCQPSLVSIMSMYFPRVSITSKVKITYCIVRDGWWAEMLMLQEREKFSALLTSTEDWLYEEGEDQNKQVYLDKLAELQVSRL